MSRLCDFNCSQFFFFSWFLIQPTNRISGFAHLMAQTTCFVSYTCLLERRLEPPYSDLGGLLAKTPQFGPVFGHRHFVAGISQHESPRQWTTLKCQDIPTEVIFLIRSYERRILFSYWQFNHPIWRYPLFKVLKTRCHSKDLHQMLWLYWVIRTVL